MVDALDQLGKFSALVADSANQTKDSLVEELQDLGPVLESLANAGPALTRALGLFATYPFPTDTVGKWARGDYANLTAVIDLTLSRLDAVLLHRHPMGGRPDRAGDCSGAAPSARCRARTPAAIRWSLPTTGTRGRMTCHR